MNKLERWEPIVESYFSLILLRAFSFKSLLFQITLFLALGLQGEPWRLIESQFLWWFSNHDIWIWSSGIGMWEIDHLTAENLFSLFLLSSTQTTFFTGHVRTSVLCFHTSGRTPQARNTSEYSARLDGKVWGCNPKWGTRRNHPALCNGNTMRHVVQTCRLPIGKVLKGSINLLKSLVIAINPAQVTTIRHEPLNL